MRAPQGLPRPWWAQKRWWVAVMLCVVTMIGYVDRLALSVAAPVVREEFGFTNEQYGFITFAFDALHARGLSPTHGWQAAFSQPVIGWTIDQYSYEPVFVTVALMHVVSGACIMPLVRRIEPVAFQPGMP